MVLTQIIIGGIGFPLIYDVIEKIKFKHQGKPYKLSLFSKVALVSYFTVSVLTAGAAFAFEFGYNAHQNALLLDPITFQPTGETVKIFDIAHYQELGNEFGKNVMLNKC
jgi:Trk-type K+ transport system membrane component